MTNPNNCAFPADAHTQSEGGLTKREYFAAMAMQGILANTEWAKTFTKDDFDEFKDRASSASTEMADALIEALNKTDNHATN